MQPKMMRMIAKLLLIDASKFGIISTQQ
nr:hypothetical protein LRH_00872 [Lacticaseibacillus rhamnosus HN001]